MNAIAATLRPIPFPTMTQLREDPVVGAFTLLRLGFFALPFLMGLDKFVKVMNDNWPAYLASEFNDIIPGTAQEAMYLVGGVEILAAIIVLVVATIRQPARRRLAGGNHPQPAARRRLR